MRTLLGAVAIHANQRPDSIALADGEETLSYAALWPEFRRWSERLADLPTGAGPIGLCLSNSLTWILLDLAAIAIGRPTVPLPPFFTAAQRRHALTRSGARVLISDAPIAELGAARPITVSARTAYVHEHDAPRVELPADTAKVTFTSGTTGLPKGVCLPQAGLERVAHSVVEAIGREYAGIHCAVLPLAILLENVAGLYATLFAGGRYFVPPLAAIGLDRPFSPNFSALAAALRHSGASSAIVVPEILRGLCLALERERITLPAMKIMAVGGARISTKVLADAASLGLPVVQGYGLSETASVIALNTPDDNRPGSVGKPLPGVTLDFAPDGEILVAAPALLGYVGEGEAPDPFATGDIGRFDDEGYLFIEGRKDDRLITGFGRNVAPDWVESELLSHSSIGQAFVFGDGAPALAALIVPSSPAVTGAELAAAIAATNQNLPAYAEVKHWTRVAPFSVDNGQLTANGRLRRESIGRAHRDLMAACLKQSGRYVSFFEELVAATGDERSKFLQIPQIQDGLAGRISLASYIQYLAEAYHHVKHTVGLMQLADQRLSRDRVSLKQALGRYIAEETGHEEWILEDIAHAGGDAQAVRNGAPRFATELMVAYAYDFVGRANPLGFFGMVFVLESTSEQLATRGAHALMQTLRFPPDCFRYLLSHGSVDQDHMRFLENLLLQIDDRSDQSAVIHMAKAMYRLYGDVFRSIPHDRGGVQP